MKKLFFFFLILIFCSGLSFSTEVKKIPRRVYLGFSNEQLSSNNNKENIDKLFFMLPDFLYTRISSLKPIVRVKNREEADSSVIVTIKTMDKNYLLIKVALFNKERLIISDERKFNSKKTDPEKFTRFVNKTSEQFAPYMKKIKPEIKVVKNIKEKKLKKIVSRVQYADKLNKQFEFTLWGSGITRISPIIPYNFMTNKPIDRVSYIFPLILDAGWYYNKNTGLLFSLYFDKNDTMSFAIASTVENNDNYSDDIVQTGISKSENELYMAGIGYSYRSLDLISSEFNIIEYLGAVKIKAIDNIEVHYRDNNNNVHTGLTIPAGDIGWLFLNFLSLQSVLAVNPLAWVSIKTKVALNINLSVLVNPDFGKSYYSRDLSTLFFQFFQLGIAFKI